jgi:hypothetical protein
MRLGNGSGCFQVRLAEGCVAYAKQATNGHDRVTPDAAHEYIAAELADMVGVYVPPTRLSRADDGALFALSVRAYPEAVTWGEVVNHFTPVQAQSLFPQLSAMWVFHAWIGDLDHQGPHPFNMMVNARLSADGSAEVAAIDHARSLSYDRSPEAMSVRPPSPYYIPLASVSHSVVAAQIDRVHSITKESCNSLISRVPPSFLKPERGRFILAGLESRASKLREVFQSILGGSL